MEFKEVMNKIGKWDQRIIVKYNGFGGKPITFILKFFSFFGRETLWLFLIVFYLFVWYDPILLSYISASFFTGLILVLVIKQTVKRKRPYEKLEEGNIRVFERKPTSRSFPSWHSFNVVSQGLLIGMVFIRSPWITILILLFAAIVSFSRIQLGVHYPSDVIFGCILGVLGFLIALFLTGPLVYNILTYIEQFVVYEIKYREINPMLFNSVGYLLLVFSIFFVIFLLAINKSIQDLLKKNKEKV